MRPSRPFRRRGVAAAAAAAAEQNNSSFPGILERLAGWGSLSSSSSGGAASSATGSSATANAGASASSGSAATGGGEGAAASGDGAPPGGQQQQQAAGDGAGAGWLGRLGVGGGGGGTNGSGPGDTGVGPPPSAPNFPDVSEREAPATKVVILSGENPQRCVAFKRSATHELFFVAETNPETPPEPPPQPNLYQPHQAPPFTVQLFMWKLPLNQSIDELMRMRLDTVRALRRNNNGAATSPSPLHAHACSLTLPLLSLSLSLCEQSDAAHKVARSVMYSDAGFDVSRCGRYLALCELDPNVGYHLRTFSLQKGSMGVPLQTVALPNCPFVTSVQFAPLSFAVLIGYGRCQAPALDQAPQYAVLRCIAFSPRLLNGSDRQLTDEVEIFSVDSTDESNVALFHPVCASLSLSPRHPHTNTHIHAHPCSWSPALPSLLSRSTRTRAPSSASSTRQRTAASARSSLTDRRRRRRIRRQAAPLNGSVGRLADIFFFGYGRMCAFWRDTRETRRVMTFFIVMVPRCALFVRLLLSVF